MFFLLLYSLDVFRRVPVFQEYMLLMTNSRFTLTYEEIFLTEKNQNSMKSKYDYVPGIILQSCIQQS